MTEEKREKTIVKTSIIGILGNILLVAFKAFVGIIAGSVAIILDAINNFTDALSSIITIIGTKLSLKKPTKKHPYGYGRIEYITSTLIAMLILFAGGMAVYESIKSIIDHFTNGTMPEFEVYSIIIIAGAILIKVLIGLFFRKKGKDIDSEALKASGIDALFDSILSTSTLIGMIVAKYANFYIEGYLGIIIGLFILKSGFGVLKESLSSLIGNRFEREYVQAIKKDICTVNGAMGAYDLILNSYGHEKFIGSVHVGVDSKLSAIEIQNIEREIGGLMYLNHGIIMTVGIYAQNEDTELSKNIKNDIHEITKDNPHVLQLHGFYLDEKNMYVIFDLVIDFDEQDPKGFTNMVAQKLTDKYPDYKFIVNIDYDY